ncbi:hypothetical protein LINPERPRIM_LOCUS35431 [Linum perenne]
MQERLNYLERCVVFRIVGEDKVRWNEFRVWATRNWGVPSASEIHPLGDDLWLLECASPKEVTRILSLNRRLFRKSEILMGPWLKMAGRSKVAWEANIVWVVIRGIPLHLRSLALAESIGEVCGDFLEAAGGSDLSSLRVKVRIRGGLPEVIPISARGEVFPVTVVPEVNFPLISAGPKEQEKEGRKGKGASFDRESQCTLGRSLLLTGECSSPGKKDTGETLSSGGGTEPNMHQLVMETIRPVTSERRWQTLEGSQSWQSLQS